jgi:hypothetical protein
MDAESKIFKEVLKHFECDDCWDPHNKLEKIWLDMGEKRYKLEGLKGFEVRTEKEMEEESMKKSTSASSSGAGVVDPTPQIKCENEKWSMLQERLKVVKAGKGHVL